MTKTIAIKVDVDTFDGMRRGVPALLSLFDRLNIKVSFFIPMGKDNTGRTVKRVFRKGFLQKAGRVGVLETYGIKTLMYGLVLPGPEIAGRNDGLLRKIIENGHEAGIHGLDHVYWHDHIKNLSRDRTFRIVDRAVSVYRKITGTAPLSFAAPGWMINAHAIHRFKELGFLYTSNTRGESPFYPCFDGNKIQLLEIPSTLPTLDEVLGVAGTDIHSLTNYFFGCLADGLNVMSIHTELEGKKWVFFLESFIKKTLDAGFQYRRLMDIAGELKTRGGIPACDIRYGSVAGRAGEVCCQHIL